MSHHDTHAHGAAPGGQGSATEPEHLEIGKVIAVGVISILVFVVGSIWALRIRADVVRAVPHRPLPASFGAEEQGIVDQIPFELNQWVARDRKAAMAKLHGYGWIDRQARTVRLPIERAMELVVEEGVK
jgi:hypothetical protein